MPTFPCTSIPEGSAARLVGLYPQKQPGLWMQRVRILGGDLSPAQWKALGRMARDFSPGTPLHMTVRQDVEFHDVPADRAPDLQTAMAEAGLTGLGACGDTVRNVTVCSGAGLTSEGPDLRPLAREVVKLLQSQEGVFALPRKFKISFSGCAKACAQPFINDLGFIAKRSGGGWAFDVVGAGSLGGKPVTGIALVSDLPARDVMPFTLGALRLFAEHGDRKVRARARLRYVRERLGDEEFRRLLLAAFRTAREERVWPEVALPAPQPVRPAYVTLRFINGDLSPEAAEALGDLAAAPGVSVRATNHHSVQVVGADKGNLTKLVSGYPALTAALARRFDIVVCPGTRWCNRGIADAAALALRIEKELGRGIPEGVTVAVSGCPNGCSQTAVADFGITGGIAGADGGKVEVWRLLVGGGMGRTPVLAHEVASGLTADDVIRELRIRSTQGA